MADLTSLQGPLDIPIPDPPPKDDEVRHSGIGLGLGTQFINPVGDDGLQYFSKATFPLFTLDGNR